MDAINLNEVIAAVVVIITTAGGIFGAVKFKNFRAAIVSLFSETPHSLKTAIDNLSSVVEAQGESIEWLRTELDRKNEELERMRKQLLATSSLAEENISLRKRVSELEEEVGALKEQLERRKKYTPKKYRMEDQ